MNYVNWSANVNTKFYGMSKSPKENSVVNEFISGRKTGYLLNETNFFNMTCNLMLNKTELSAFWSWYLNDLGALTGAFSCPQLSDNYLRFTSQPAPQDTDQLYTVLQLTIEEVL